MKSKIFIVLLIILSGCSIEKRHYMPGYYIGSLTSLKPVDKIEVSSSIKLINTPVIKMIECDTPVDPVEDEIDLMLKSDKEIRKEKRHERYEAWVKSKQVEKRDKEAMEREARIADSLSHRSYGGNVFCFVFFTLTLIGSVLAALILAEPLFIVVSIVSFIIIIAAAAGMGNIARHNRNADYLNRPKQEQLIAPKNNIDIVYLKNGSRIKGKIIEEVPNDKLKIETADGSVFVYKYTEIEKITHENK